VSSKLSVPNQPDPATQASWRLRAQELDDWFVAQVLPLEPSLMRQRGACNAIAEKFLAYYLGGRYEPTTAAEIEGNTAMMVENSLSQIISIHTV
jgi:hypothetical protein